MAGEWLKFECSLPEKPETMAVTIAMGWDDPDLTVGKLMRLFRWFDAHTVDGNARGVTAALLDRLIGVTGFVQAVADVGWIVVTADGLALHNFDRHNGATAKSRAMTAKRVANHRSNGPCNAESNAPTVTAPLAREEKRREEEKKPTAWAPPDWIDSKVWDSFVAMRKAKGKRAPFTDAARDGIVQDLVKIRDAGLDANESLRQSVINGWSGVFAKRGDARPAQAGADPFAGAH